MDRRRNSEAFLQSIIDNIPLVVTVKDAETRRYVTMNQSGLAILERSSEEVVGKRRSDLFSTDLAAELDELDRRVVEEAEPVELGGLIVPSEDGDRILRLTKVPITSVDGRVGHVMSIAEDITDREASVAELEAARAEAEQANSAKSEFLSTISRDLACARSRPSSRPLS